MSIELKPIERFRLKLLRDITFDKRDYIHTISIIGKMVSGKSTLGLLLALMDSDKIVITDSAETIDHLHELRKGLGKPTENYDISILFDDFGFQITGRSREDRERLTKLFKIRHILGLRRYNLIFISHYVRSLAPFIRSTNAKILTTLDTAEIPLYVQDRLFMAQDLWDYYSYLAHQKYKAYLILIQRFTGHILDITLRASLIRQLEKILEESKVEKYSTDIYTIYKPPLKLSSLLDSPSEEKTGGENGSQDVQ